MTMYNSNSLSQIWLALFVSVISQILHCEAHTLNVNRLPISTYPKTGINNAIPQISNKLPVLPPSILSDYYNSLISQPDQYPKYLPINSWPQTEFIPIAEPVENEYNNGEEYYDENSDQLRLPQSGVYYGSDAYQPDGWFNGPVILDTPDSDVQNDELSNAQLNNLMMSYLFDQYEKLNNQKEVSEKRSDTKKMRSQTIGTTTSPTVTPLTSTVGTVTTHRIPKKLTAKQFRLFQRGQKEFPLLRPSSDDKPLDSTDPEWPQELEENKLSEEESLMSLKKRGQSRTVRDVLTAQLDNLKKEGPKMH